MAFRLREDARVWFQLIFPKGKSLDYDIYHLCFIAGLTTGKKAEVSGTDAPVFYDSFPGEYRQRGRLLVAAFLTCEIRALGVSMGDRRALHAAIHRLVDPLSPSHLSDQGLKEFNKYSFGGFDALTSWFDERPRNIETFLPEFHQQLMRHEKGHG